MRLRPVVDDAEIVADVAARALRTPFVLAGELDVDVFRLHPSAGGPDIVARAFGPAVRRENVDAVVTVLTELAGTRFPSERCATSSPVLQLGGGRHLLLTEFVESSPEPRPGFLVAWCAALLGRLAARPGEGLPQGGGWSRLGATPGLELDAALQLAASLGPAAGPLVDALSDADDAKGLPEALIHPDLVPANAIPRGEEPPVVIDWIGVGRGPRAWPLAVLLHAAGPRAAARSLARWTRSAELTRDERERLPGIMLTRPVALDVWSVAHERMTMHQAIGRLHDHRARIGAIAAALDLPQPEADTRKGETSM